LAVAPGISGGQLGVLQHQGKKARVSPTKIEAGVAEKPSSPQNGNGSGGGLKSCGGGGSGDRRTMWASSEKALEGGGASVRGGVLCERKQSEGWHGWPFTRPWMLDGAGQRWKGGTAGVSMWRDKEGGKRGPWCGGQQWPPAIKRG
jgi:hypothetical protein